MSTTPKKHPNHAMRRLVGAVVIAGATYAAEKILTARRRKREEKAGKK